ncbi:spermatogenesis-associated protein 1 [Caerostris extrusa]|uniref:Spermatogenesis-associated protein 1 n=1 Tax=Caerostris extrusa TaxID=172846 RepID=A0AAV4XJL4_CAEEX|nr:spermatogenesis-associated protein 1 [Caerostris extrusa]
MVINEERLLTILNEVRGETRIRQRQREDLLRKIKQLQSRAHQRRKQVREMWRKRYLEAKNYPPDWKRNVPERPSNKLSYKIMIARLLQEIEDLTRRVEGTRLKLHTELKLRSMAEKDVRSLREDLLKKRFRLH